MENPGLASVPSTTPSGTWSRQKTMKLMSKAKTLAVSLVILCLIVSVHQVCLEEGSMRKLFWGGRNSTRTARTSTTGKQSQTTSTIDVKNTQGIGIDIIDTDIDDAFFLGKRNLAVECINQLYDDQTSLLQSVMKIHAPIPAGVKRIGAHADHGSNQLQVSFNIRRPPQFYKKQSGETATLAFHQAQRDWYSKAKWFCNGEERAKLWPEDSLRNPQFGRDMLIMQCPDTTNFVQVRDVQQVINTTKPLSSISYNLTKYLECEDKSKWLYQSPKKKKKSSTTHAPTTSSSSSRSTLALCTMVDQSATNLIPQWIEYYRLIGFDHVWIYWNDEWDRRSPDLIRYMERPDVLQYASLIPWKWDGTRGFIYQPSQTTDCLAVSRQQKFTWTFLADVDEYLQLMDHDVPSLRDFLKPYEDRNVSGLEVPNWFFGAKNTTVSKGPKPEDVLLMNEYQYRAPKAVKHFRAKTLVRPEKVVHFHVHWISQSIAKHSFVVLNATTELRHCHFKKPNRGVKDVEKPVKDSSLFDAYASQLQKRLWEVGWNRTILDEGAYSTEP
jgi:hypothetical protein